MPRFKVYAQRITDIETIIDAPDKDTAEEIAEDLDSRDRRWIDSGNDQLDKIDIVPEETT